MSPAVDGQTPNAPQSFYHATKEQLIEVCNNALEFIYEVDYAIDKLKTYDMVISLVRLLQVDRHVFSSTKCKHFGYDVAPN